MKRGTMRVRAEAVNLRAPEVRRADAPSCAHCGAASPAMFPVPFACRASVPACRIVGRFCERHFIGSAADTAALQALGTSTAACQCLQLATGTVAIHW